MTAAEIRQGIEQLGPWFYRFDFGDGLATTPLIPESVVGIFDTRLQMLSGAVDRALRKPAARNRVPRHRLP